MSALGNGPVWVSGGLQSILAIQLCTVPCANFTECNFQVEVDQIALHCIANTPFCSALELHCEEFVLSRITLNITEQNDKAQIALY